jgi:hypothetical protein
MVDCFLFLVTQGTKVWVLTDFFVPIYRLSNIDHGIIETSPTRDKKREEMRQKRMLCTESKFIIHFDL